LAQDSGPAAAKVLHIAVDVLTIVTLTAIAALACILVTCVMTRIIRKRWARRRASLYPVSSAARQLISQDDSEPGCPACGGTRTVRRAIAGRRHEDQSCPACQPASRAG
jgi:predicted RNA-binding Zn-ribbon protein involved in translation (DUF1610 family)